MKNKAKINVCNERGIFMKHVIIGAGIGIFMSVVLLLLSFIGGTVFMGLTLLVVVCSLFIFYEPRIERAEVTKDGAIFKLSKQVEAISTKQAEPIHKGQQFEAFTSESYGTDEKAQLVIKSIGGTKYTFRNIEGITTDSNIPQDIVKDKINWLILHGLANVFEISGEKMYALSPKGHVVFQNTIKENKNS